MNKLQASRISALEQEIARLIRDNMQLRSELIQVQQRCGLQQKKSLIERKIRELSKLVKSLAPDQSVTLSLSPISSLSAQPCADSPSNSHDRQSRASLQGEIAPGKPNITHAPTEPLAGIKAMRKTRRVSRNSDEIVYLPEFQGYAAVEGRIPRGMTGNLEDWQMSAPSSPYRHKEAGGPIRKAASGKENIIENDSSSRQVCSSPIQQRIPLHPISDPAPLRNIMQIANDSPGKLLTEVVDIKLEPGSPTELSYRRDTTADTDCRRPRRAKEMNYAEPSLRMKMRRSEVLPADRRRRSVSSRKSLEIGHLSNGLNLESCG